MLSPHLETPPGGTPPGHSHLWGVPALRRGRGGLLLLTVVLGQVATSPQLGLWSLPRALTACFNLPLTTGGAGAAFSHRGSKAV